MGTNRVKKWAQTCDNGEPVRRSRMTAQQVLFQRQIPAQVSRCISLFMGSWVSLTPWGNVIAITAVLFHQPAACWAAVESDVVFIRSAKKRLRAACWVEKPPQGFSRCSHAIWGMMTDFHNFADSAIHDWAVYMQGRINSVLHRSLKESAVCFLQVRDGG